MAKQQLNFLLQIVVEDINDNPPRFESLPYAVVMPGSSRGSTVTIAAAVDDDALSNGEITYELEERGNGDVNLDIDKKTGKVYLASDAAPFFEPEKMTVAVATIKAIDGAAQAVRLTSTTTLTVLGGRADPGPEFTQETYRVSVKENSPVGTPVGKVALVTDDGRSRGELPKFFLVGSESLRGRDRGLFEVDEKTGQVRTVKDIDREIEGDKIVLNIIALFSNSMSTCKVN